jgi:dephospho-CoA kinase
MMKVGLTGGIGSGKSVVGAVFRLLGIPVYDSDKETKKLYDTDTELKEKLMSHFGATIYVDSHFQRDALRAIVFEQPDKLKLLNELVHPVVKQHSANWFLKQKAPYAIKESALLFEAAANVGLQKIILVSCPEEKRIERAMHRDHVTREAILLRMKHQLPEEQKRMLVDFEIRNDDVQAILPQVLVLHEELIALSRMV